MPLANHASRVIHLYHKELCELACFHHFISELIVQNVLNNVQENDETEHDTGWLVTFSFFFILVEKNLLRNFLSVAKMASLVYERENCWPDWP